MMQNNWVKKSMGKEKEENRKLTEESNSGN